MVESTDVTKVTSDTQRANELSWASQESVSIGKRAANLPQAGLPAVKWSLLIAEVGSHLTAPPACGRARSALKLRVNIKRRI
jgi:hypothetical protein